MLLLYLSTSNFAMISSYLKAVCLSVSLLPFKAYKDRNWVLFIIASPCLADKTPIVGNSEGLSAWIIKEEKSDIKILAL